MADKLKHQLLALICVGLCVFTGIAFYSQHMLKLQNSSGSVLLTRRIEKVPSTFDLNKDRRQPMPSQILSVGENITEDKPNIKETFLSYKIHRKNLPRKLTFSPQQMDRKKILNEFCKGKAKLKGNNVLRRLDLSHVIVNEMSGALFCSLPKVASTNWKRTFLAMDNKTKNNYLSTLKGSDIHDMMRRPNLQDRRYRTKTVLQDFYKLIFVRHPFERLASCYRDKFVMYDKTGREKPHFQMVYGSRILAAYRKGLSRKEIEKGFGVTFTEFTRWLVEKRVRNEHWDPMFDICQPCLIDYDFIGDMSTLQKDASEALHHIGLKDTSNFEHKMSQTAVQGFKVSSRQLAKELFEELDQGIIDKLYKKYEKDFKAFGFSRNL